MHADYLAACAGQSCETFRQSYLPFRLSSFPFPLLVCMILSVAGCKAEGKHVVPAHGASRVGERDPATQDWAAVSSSSCSHCSSCCFLPACSAAVVAARRQQLVPIARARSQSPASPSAQQVQLECECVRAPFDGRLSLVLSTLRSNHVA